MKPTRFLFTALTLCGISFVFAANAEDSKPIEPILEQKPVSFSLLSRDAFNWTGFYIGGNIGGILNNYNISRYDVDVDTVHQFEETFLFLDGTGTDRPASASVGSGLLEFFSDDADTHNGPQEGTIMGGGQFGAQMQFGHFVFGVEGDIDRVATSASRHFEDSAVTSFLFKGEIGAATELFDKRRVETNWNGSVRARLGYASGPCLFYATGGVAFSDVTMWASDRARTVFFLVEDGQLPAPGVVLGGGEGIDFIAAASNSNLSRDHEVQVGWTAGAGLEIALTEMLTIGLEYRHSDFGDDNYHFSSHDGPIVPGHSHVDFDSDQVTMRVNVLLNQFFGHPAAGVASGEKVSTESGLTMAGMSAKDKTVEPVVEPFNWTGLYFGAHIGGVWNNYDFGGYDTDLDVFDEFEQNAIAAEAPTSASGTHTAKNAMLDQQVIVDGQSVLSFHTPGLSGTSDDSIMGGIQLGYNFQFGHFVFGVEGDWSGMTSDGHSPYFTSSITTIDFFDGESASADLTTYRKAETNWTASGRARVGWANGRLMLYATGGVAVADVTVRSQDNSQTIFFSDIDSGLILPPFADFDGAAFAQNADHEDNLQFGWTAGGGAEWAAKDTVSFALEYRHNDFGSDSYHINNAHNGALNPGNTHLDLDSDQVTLRVNILLGHLGK